jgi:hypothetical protein
MPISKSLSEDITSPTGNSLAIFKEDDSDLLMLKDIYGNNEPLNNYLNYQGSFYDTTTQTSLGSEIKILTFNSTYISNGISLINNSQLKVSQKGIYNLQFSAQLTKTSGANLEIAYIWFRKNGQDIPNSASTISIQANNNTRLVPSWNFFADMNKNDYLEIVWYTTDVHIVFLAVAESVNIPAIPSVIVTMSKV